MNIVNEYAWHFKPIGLHDLISKNSISQDLLLFIITEFTKSIRIAHHLKVKTSFLFFQGLSNVLLLND
jgi:hypothetical protein